MSQNKRVYVVYIVGRNKARELLHFRLKEKCEQIINRKHTTFVSHNNLDWT